MKLRKAYGTVFVSFLFAALTVGGAGQLRAQTSPQEAAQFVQSLGSEAVILHKATRTKPAAKRLAALRDLVRKGFNLELTSQFVLGKHWNKATEKQRAQFQDLFTEYLLNSYVRHISTYRAETLSVVGSHPVGHKDVLVETTVEGAEGPVNPVWRVRGNGGEYKIIDVTLDGVSLALTQRREFTAVINQQGLDGLLNLLREKLSAQAKAAEAKPRRQDRRLSLFASILASPNANRLGLLLARR